MKAEPQNEHAWLQQLVGEWTSEMECVMGPDQPPMQTKGAETVRSIGGLWTVGEGRGDTPDGTPATSLMTLGYDPQKQRFVGSFVASMMTHQWLYEGTLDASGKVLTLDTEGPSFAGDGSMTKYQDVIEIKSADHRVLTSRALGPDGTWNQFVTAHYHRVK
jgi:hypothetical protein